MTLLTDKQRVSFPPVLNLNVGGRHFTTSLATVTRFTSMIATMFSGRHQIDTDENGRYFIDRDGAIFEYILAFMRSQVLPPVHMTQVVYDEASYLSFDQLVNRLAPMRIIAGAHVKDTFLSTIPNYHQNFAQILDIGKRLALENGGSRRSKVRVAVYKNESDSDQGHLCNVDVTFGPWKGQPSVPDLLHCIKVELIELGYEAIEYNCIGVCDDQFIRLPFPGGEKKISPMFKNIVYSQNAFISF